ncbi:phage tail protein [Endozoicomonas lisbonensis]|uniref:Phage tail protein n=1 Tax=Endozoicomonas lisbonensis TaxID=3120522 RepID=A0ABV2SGV5_9GAMM
MSSKLKSLTCYLISKKQCRQEDLDSWVDHCRIIPESSVEGEYCQLHLNLTTCTLFIEEFSGNATELVAHVSAWLQDNDDPNDRQRFGLTDPEMDITMLDSSGKKWDVDISLQFLEPVLVQEDPNGSIEWDSTRWSLIEEPVVDVATEAEGVFPA